PVFKQLTFSWVRLLKQSRRSIRLALANWHSLFEPASPSWPSNSRTACSLNFNSSASRSKPDWTTSRDGESTSIRVEATYDSTALASQNRNVLVDGSCCNTSTMRTSRPGSFRHISDLSTLVKPSTLSGAVTPEPGGDLLIRTPCSLICKSARCAEFVDLFISFRREAHLIEGRDLKELVAALPTLLRELRELPTEEARDLRTTSASDYDEFNMFNERDESRCSSRLDQHISSSRPAAADAAAAAAINDFGQQPTPRRGARSDVSDDPPDELLQGLDNIGRNITHQDVRTMMAALQQQMERPVSKQVKIVKFTPSQDIHVWLAAFEQRCEMERIVDPFEMKQHLIASLDLATAYPALLGMNLPRFASYEEVKQRLIERFARHGGADEYRELLRRRQQGKNESAEEFADALRTLGERAYPRMHPEDREKEITDQFLAGIRTTPDLRERLYWVRPNNLLAAIRELRRLEGAKELAHRSAQPPVRMLDGEEDGDPKPDVTAQALLTLTDLIEKQQRMLDHLVQRDQQQVASPPKRAIICYSCGQPGHRNTQCPMRQNQGNGQAESDNGTALREVQAQATWQIQNGREKKRMSAAQAPMPSPTVALSDAECGGFVDTSPNQKIHAREADPYVTGRVASREVPFLLDSGSRKNFLGSSTWAAIRRRMPRCIISHAIPDCVTMYDGTQLPLACKVTIPVEFGDVVADTEFLVTVSDCENLLGVSFMREHCQNLDFAQGMLTFNNGTCIPVRYSRRELQNCRVYTSEKCTLPPRSSALLAVRLDDGHPENRGSPSIVELVKSRLHPSCNALEAAPALMTMPEGRGYIEVVNTADSEVFLQAGIRVGVATPLRTADLMYLSETPEPEVRHLPKNSEESSTAWLDEVEINSELSKEQHQRVRDLLVECQAAFSKHSLDAGLTHLLNHRKGKDHANADALSRRPEAPPIFFEHGRLLEQPGSTARPGDDHDLEPDLDPTPEATARAALQKTVHSRCLEAKTDLDEDLEATAPAAFQHDAHRCSQRLETGLDDNSEATATTALCRDAHAAYRNLETNLDEDLEATVDTDLLDDAQDFRSRNLETPTDQDSKATAPAALLMTARNATPGKQLKLQPFLSLSLRSLAMLTGPESRASCKVEALSPGPTDSCSSPEKTHPILTTTEPTATAACDEACFTCCVPPYSQESPGLCSGGMRAAPSAESSVMRAMKRTSIRDQRTYADVVRQSPSERPNPDADKTVPCDRPGAIKAETAGIRTPQPCRAVLTDFLKLPMTRQQFVEAQRADRAISYVLNLVKDEAPKPEFDARLRLTKEQRNLLGYYENLQEDNGLLLIDLSDGQQPPKVVLPEALDAQVLQELHSSPLCGHLGETKTLLRLRERFWRPGLARATKTFISKCRTCLESKSRRRERVPVQSFPVCEVLGRIHCDVVGPIAQKSKSGNRYILTLCDATSKYPFAYPMRNQKAKTVIKLLQERFIPDVHPVTGFTPHYLVFGRDFRLPIDNALKKLPEYADLPDYVKDFQRRLDEATELAKERLHLHQQLRDEHYSNLPAAKKLQPGDLVFLNNPVLEPDEAAKFHRPRKAFVEPKGEVVYKIRRRLPNPRARRDELVVHRRNLLLVPDADYTRTSDPEPGGDLLIRTPCSLICKSARCAEFVDLFISFRREAHLIEGRDLKELLRSKLSKRICITNLMLMLPLLLPNQLPLSLQLHLLQLHWRSSEHRRGGFRSRRSRPGERHQIVQLAAPVQSERQRSIKQRHRHLIGWRWRPAKPAKYFVFALQGRRIPDRRRRQRRAGRLTASDDGVVKGAIDPGPFQPFNLVRSSQIGHQLAKILLLQLLATSRQCYYSLRLVLTALVPGNLAADAVSDGGDKFAAKSKFGAQFQSKIFGRISGLADVPFELNLGKLLQTNQLFVLIPEPAPLPSLFRLIGVGQGTASKWKLVLGTDEAAALDALLVRLAMEPLLVVGALSTTASRLPSGRNLSALPDSNSSISAARTRIACQQQQQQQQPPLYYLAPGVGRRVDQLSEEEQIKIAKRIGLISHLPVRLFSEAAEQGKNYECVICMVDYVEGDRLRSLPCTHTYHKDCIDDWLMRSFACPSCNQPVDAALLTTFTSSAANH
uniref:CCHC-type domain-containing protein n=1 Tax=Macrostomum lignano TaxID=282301 RepID=A0A1I8HX02_9PLAT